MEKEWDRSEPALFSCPDCQGALWELKAGKLLRFRCHVGHTYSPQSLMETEAAEVDRTLWSAIRALEELAAAGRRLARRASDFGYEALAANYESRARQRDEEADAVRRIAESASTKKNIVEMPHPKTPPPSKVA